MGCTAADLIVLNVLPPTVNVLNVLPPTTNVLPPPQDANKDGMDLREGRGNEFRGRKPSEDDLLNVVWVVDSNALPFYRVSSRRAGLGAGMGGGGSGAGSRAMGTSLQAGGCGCPWQCGVCVVVSDALPFRWVGWSFSRRLPGRLCS